MKNLFHIGFPKCRTLQKSVLPYLNDYIYLGLSEDLNVGIAIKSNGKALPTMRHYDFLQLYP